MAEGQSAAILSKLREIKARLDMHALEMTSLRAALDTQFKRIADMQAELDVLPAARDRRKKLRSAAFPPASMQSGNGSSDR